MVPNKFKSLVSTLVDKTVEGNARWATASVADRFELNLRTGTLFIDHSVDADGEHYMLTVLNDRGGEISEFRESNGDADFELLEELYKSAKRRCYKVDETIDGIMEEIESEEQIGGYNGGPVRI